MSKDIEQTPEKGGFCGLCQEGKRDPNARILYAARMEGSRQRLPAFFESEGKSEV